MTLLCRTCSRLNPADARYCYYDGAVLDGGSAQRGPIAVAVQSFPSPFVFPSGQACHSFDELVHTCDSSWEAARTVLTRGYLEAFFGGLGRADLALAAQHAARNPDPDRGLDQLLNKLPCSQREPPRLFVQPQEISLGQVDRGSDRTIELHIENQGTGLLQGTVASDHTEWLMLGDAAGSPRKVFQCHHDFTLHVQVIARRLRASPRPLEGRLTVTSNGGTAAIIVRLDVPIQPFPDGVLAGATTPRQVAEKAKANARAAAVLFEKGAVASWYESNGWTYPVQGPAASGLGAVQQFFEALGLTTPPRVEISETRLQVQGAPGAALEHVIQVQAQEKRPVFAHATTNTPWLQIGRIVLDGRTARIPVRVPAVPSCPGQQLDGKVQVTANGQQRFVVEVSLSVTGKPLPASASAAPVLSMDDVLAAAPILSAADIIPTTPGVQMAQVAVPAIPVAVVREVPAAPSSPPPFTVLPEVEEAPSPRPPSPPPPSPEEPGSSGRGLRHLLPLGLLALLLLIPLIHDLLLGPGGSSGANDDPDIAIQFHDGPKGNNAADQAIMPRPTMRFGLVMLRERDPEHPDRLKRLTFDEWGRSNNTCVRVDGDPPALFGNAPGVWVERQQELPPDSSGHPRRGLSSSWKLEAKKIVITQEAELVPGPQSSRLDTCLVRYQLENQDGAPHTVGIRFLLDTFIGANDGVPFTIPGKPGLCDTMERFHGPKAVPDFIQALENDNLANPGTVAYLQLRLSSQIESPTQVTLGGWPNPALNDELPPFIPQALGPETLWDVPYISMREVADRARRLLDKTAKLDSAVTMYWEPRPLPPGGKRVVGFTYGLGTVASDESGGRILLTVGGRLSRQGEFTLTALVHDPQAGEKLSLILPPSFQLVEGASEQTVPAVAPGSSRHDSPLTWRIRAGEDGDYKLGVRSSTGTGQMLPITIRSRGVFD